MRDDLPPETSTAEDRQTPWRTWAICGLMLLATMLNYMDRQTLAQQAAEIRDELRLSNEDYGRLEKGFGLAFAVGSLVLGVIADRVSLRWLYPAILLGWSTVGFLTGLGQQRHGASSLSCAARFLRGRSMALRWRPHSGCCLATDVLLATAYSRAAHRWARSSRRQSSCS